MTVIEAIESVDMDEIIDSMNAYAMSRLKSIGVKNFRGKESEDFVGDLILKVIEEQRNWSKAQCTFREFLFGCLKSEISNFFTTANNNNHTADFPDLAMNDSSLNSREEREQILTLLKNDGANNDELEIFDSWLDGVFKPAEIASATGKKINEVYSGIKRLERRLPKIRQQAINII